MRVWKTLNSWDNVARRDKSLLYSCLSALTPQAIVCSREKSEQRGIDLRSRLLLYPVATIGQNLCLDRRHPEPHLLDPHVWAYQFKNRISSAAQKQGGLRDPGIAIGSQQFPVSITIPIPVETAGKARAGELLDIVCQVDLRQPGRQRSGYTHVCQGIVRLLGEHRVPALRRGRVPGCAIQKSAHGCGDIAFKCDLGHA